MRGTAWLLVSLSLYGKIRKKKTLVCTRSEFIERRQFARQYNGGCELFCDAFVAQAARSSVFQGLRQFRIGFIGKHLLAVRENRQRHDSQQRPFECAKSPTIEQSIKPRSL